MNDRGNETEGLLAGATQLGLELGGEQAARLIGFLDLLYRWNPSAGLTRVDRADAVRLHLLDSLSLLPHVLTGGRLADLGTGGGLPGLVLALALPGLEVELVDSRRRCCSFLGQAATELGVATRVSVRQADAASLPGPYRTVVSRAFRPPVELVGLAAPLLEPGGRLLVMASARTQLEAAELARLGPGLVADGSHELVLPGGPESRRILVLSRSA